MAFNLLTQIFGSRNDRLLKQFRKTLERINGLEAKYEQLNDDALRQKTNEFKQRVSQGESLDALLPEAFAVVREGSKRVMKMRHFDVQMMGGIALHQGKIAEMRTGEGKTLTATLAVYLNALSGKGVHVVTVNDYLAQRDAEWMGRVYKFLGMSVGVIVHGLDDGQRKNFACTASSVMRNSLRAICDSVRCTVAVNGIVDTVRVATSTRRNWPPCASTIDLPSSSFHESAMATGIPMSVVRSSTCTPRPRPR